MRSIWRQLLTRTVLGICGISLVFAPTLAYAQVNQLDAANTAANINSSAQNTVETTTSVKQNVWDSIKIVFANSAALALLNAGNYFTQRIAYDTATWMASGGKGQQPLFVTKGAGAWLKDVAANSAADAIGTFSENRFFEQYGINLCRPTNPRIALNISLGFALNLPNSGQPQPRCSWNEVASNWDAFTDQDSSQVLDQVGVMFTPGQSTLSAAFEFNAFSRQLGREEKEFSIFEYITNDAFKSVTDPVTGRVLTPAETVRRQMELSQEQGFRQQDRDILITGDAFAAGAYGVLGAAIQTFTNTLAQKMMQRVFQRGIISINELIANESGTNPLANADAARSGGRAAAELANADLLTPKIFSVSNYDALLEFSSCSADFRYPNNCVIDNQFYTAVSRAEEGAPLTLRQAVDQGFINGSWRMIPASHPKNTEKGCYQEAFCYSNLIKLRNARIIPIGWELAANSQFNDATNPVTLREAMDKFNDCPLLPDGTVDFARLPDPIHPWCRLVDPNWVLKYPEQICRQQAPGPVLLNAASAARAQVCTDAPSCIATDASGNCVGGYGYCVREKNVWQFNADSCPAQFASCQAFNSPNGPVSYLTSTVTAGVCDAGNAGCRQYSLSKNLVPNSGFEESVPVAGGRRGVIGWNTANSGHDYSSGGGDSYQGMSALGGSGFVFSFAIAQPSVIPGQSYRMAVNAKTSGASTGTGTFRVHFYDQNAIQLIPTGLPAAISNAGITTDCALGPNGAIDLPVTAGPFGYASADCTVTAPPNAAFVDFGLSTNGPKMWFDDLGFYGTAWSAAPSDNIFLNAKAKSCPEGQAGCTELVRASTGTLNLIQNPGFETADDGVAARWTMASSQYLNREFTGFEGASAARATGSDIVQTARGLLPNATYVFSAYSKREDAASNALAQITVLNDDGLAVAIPSNQTDCDVSGSSLTLNLGNGTDFARAVCRFTTPGNVGGARVAIRSAGNPAIVDAIQLELSAAETPYHAGYSSSAERVNLKIAPKGLQCSGAATDAPSCGNYAQACLREEVGCNRFTPISGTAVTAVTTAADLCPAACAGYDAFRPDPTAFSPTPAGFVYMIPSTATACSAAEAGCEEFTNLATLAEGGEAREYYTELRLCKRPDATTGTFYTWEGNAERGFQLRTWALALSDVPAASVSAADPSGGTAPCTNLRYDTSGNPVCRDAANTPATCDKASLAFNLDCREFYDTQGRVHYRLYSRTIVASENCTELRMTRAVESDCTASGGLWIRNECHYFSLRSESTVCRAAAVSCRGYTGNASRNIRNVIDDGFEGGTTAGWSGGGAAVSNESVSVGGHSLRFTGVSTSKDVTGEEGIKQGKTYTLTFWAKGAGDLRASFSIGGSEIRFGEGVASLGSEWKVYTLGPAVLDRLPTSGDTLVLIKTSSAAVYVDNIVLQEVADSIYVVADSWRTPAQCDQAPNGAASPRYMLGCRAYRDKDNQQVYLKSFSQLCRESAVGCEAMYHTQNSDSPFAETKDAVCSLSSACVASSSPNGVTCPCVVSNKTVCQVSNLETSCRYDVDGEWSDGDAIDPAPDVIRVPADAMVYVINDRRYACDAGFQGCSIVGDRELNPDGDLVQSWKEKALINDPDTYAETLCSKSEEYCQAYTRTEDGTTAYFKDPGNHTCDFKQGVNVNGVQVSGWFKKGTDEPCYVDNFQSGNFFGIWKNSDTAYGGWAGSCPATQSRCKEFIDPTDVAPEYPQGFAYYAIMNDRLDTRTCSNQVSRTTSPSAAKDASACVLFRQSDNLNLTASAAATYDASDARFGALVAPVNRGIENDANIIIRVKRDRQCGAWLDCRTSENVFNPSTGQFQNVCTAFALCAEYQKIGDSTRCVRYITNENSGEILTPGLYAGRDILWSGKEYSGYSIPDRYPVEELSTVIATVGGREEPRLAYVGGSCSGELTACSFDPDGSGPLAAVQGSCFGGKCAVPVDGSSPARTETALRQAGTSMPSVSCRAYPQEDAPFPSSVADPGGWDLSQSEINGGNPVHVSNSPAFKGANVCQRRLVGGVEVSSCECSYAIASYGSQVKKYLPVDGPDLPRGYCDSGTYESFECDPLAAGLRDRNNLSCCSKLNDASTAANPICESGGQCQPLTKIDYLAGYEGQCLENDLTIPLNNRRDQFACATWRPVGLVGGTRDIYNLNRTAGYFAPPDRRFYCVGDQPAWSIHLPIVTTIPEEFAIPAGFSYELCVFNNPPEYCEAIAERQRQLGGGSASAGGDFGDKGPLFQLTNLFFGPGRVVGLKPAARSAGLDCQEGNTVLWCVVPALSSPCGAADIDPDTGQPVTTASCPDNAFVIQEPAYGILGCYEVSDGLENFEPTSIEYPYIGPPIYRDQLANIYFDVTRDFDDSPGADLSNVRDAVNPDQAVNQACNDDDSNDTIVNGQLIQRSTGRPVQTTNYVSSCRVIDGVPQDSDCSFSEAARCRVRPGETTGYCDPSTDNRQFLQETNGWKRDLASSGGSVIFEARFNSSGRLVSLYHQAKDSNDEGTYGIAAMGFTFRSGCENVAQVDAPGEFGLTKAYTDTVNAIRQFTDPSVDGVPTTRFEQACRPWGAIGAISSEPLATPTIMNEPWTYVVRHAASPTTNVETEVNACTVTSFRSGSRYQLDNRESPSAIQRLFRAVFRVWDHDQLYNQDRLLAGGALSRPLYTAVDETYDLTGEPDYIGESIIPPRVASVDTTRCDSSGRCPVKSLDTLTVSGRDGGIINAAGGAFQADLKFFAWGSHDAMPIVQRIIDWGDASSSEPAARGWYKNHKPYCSSDSSDTGAIFECVGVPGLTCKDDADCPGTTCRVVPEDQNRNRFGNTPGACTDAPFSFSHTYTCSAKDLADIGGVACDIDPATGISRNAPCVITDGTGARTCVYQPRVTVIDNWGWCNCSGSVCSTPNGVLGTYGVCALGDAIPAGVDLRPWTAYRGDIRVGE